MIGLIGRYNGEKLNNSRNHPVFARVLYSSYPFITLSSISSLNLKRGLKMVN